MTILVTGACGFVGLNILEHLVERYPAHAVVAADREAIVGRDRRALGPGADRILFRALDVTDPKACAELIGTIRPSHIVHAAAVTVTDDTALTPAVNAGGTANVLQAAVLAGGVARCLILSSSAVYDQGADSDACDEDHPLRLDNAYACSKAAAEQLMAGSEARGGFAVAAVRVGPVYGPFERPRATRPYTSLVRQLLDYRRDGRPVRIGGADYGRDWTHAADVAAALGGLLFAGTLRHRVYNASAGRRVTAREIVSGVAGHGLRARWVGGADADLVLRPEDGRKPLVIGRLRRDGGFVPRFDFPGGLADTVAADDGRPRSALTERDMSTS